jgi:prevent-host-death family protein
MEKTVTAADANRRFSRLLREVRDGHSYIVTSHGRPVARIAPVIEQRSSQSQVALLAHLEGRPVRRRPIGHWKRDELYD